MEGTERDHRHLCGMVGPVRVKIIVSTVSLTELCILCFSHEGSPSWFSGIVPARHPRHW